MIKLILGGFPCTQFSLAQKKNRINKVDFTAEEFVEFHNNNRLWYKHIDDFEKYIGDKLGVDNYKFAEGLQLFFNCIAAIDRTIEQYPNDKVYYMFENVSSMQKEIKETLTEILNRLYGGVSTEINSALVSAQNRKRIYFTNYGEIPQPEDKGILLKDILESGIVDKEKAYALKHQACNARDYIKKHHTAVAFEPVNITKPIKVGEFGNGGQGNRIYSIDGKAVAQTSTSGGIGSNTGLYAEPVAIGYRSRLKDGKNVKRYEANPSGKANALTTVMTDSMVAEPVQICECIPVNTTSDGKAQCLRATCYKDGMRNMIGNNVDKRTCVATPVNITEPIRLGDIDSNAQAHRVYSPYGKSVTINAGGGGQCGKTGLYATPVEIVITEDTVVEELWGGNLKIDGKLIYKVENGLIPFKEDFYPINLPDGYYLIRKLTVKECKRLQTIPEWYEFPVSDTQAYKMLGNGWTKDVISHILSFIPNIQNEEIDVLSLYDGMSCGKLALIDLGCEKNINTYRAYEIDPYAIKTTQHNFPDTIQCGDAFKVRDIDWEA